ncbi:MAG: PspA/IM30 family protein [Planctomycetota bacterium]|nr:PspA/IM30 family protein [Planctomycetota bacterium]
MWERIKRMFRSIIGAFISLGEDPKLILEQNIRDMQDKVPQINTGLAKARAGVIKLENEADQYNAEIRQLTAKIKACIAAGDEGLGGQLAVRLRKTQEALARNQEQLAAAKQGYESLVKLKERYLQEVHRKTEEAMAAIKASEAAKWKAELADVFESFEVAGVDQTHDEMVAKLRDKAADAEGKLAVAAETIDMKSIQLEEKANEIQGRELLQQFKAEMGLAAPQGQADSSGPAKSEEKTIGPMKEKTK